MVEKITHDNVALFSKRTAANRRNARLSTGPKTQQGKSRSRRNAVKHGILASALLITEGKGAENPAEFHELLRGLHRDLTPTGALEKMLVEKIAVCWWRQQRALSCEAGLVRRAFAPDPGLQLEESLGFGHQSRELAVIKDQLRLPLGADLDRILRYETTIQREFAYAINQLERMQRARKGKHVPAPVSVQVSSDQ
jgi:hypothetical protein